jgi:hypothetical protein
MLWMIGTQEHHISILEEVYGAKWYWNGTLMLFLLWMWIELDLEEAFLDFFRILRATFTPFAFLKSDIAPQRTTTQ